MQVHCNGASGTGAFPERQKFFASRAQPPYRFWDRASALLMSVIGWEGEWQLISDHQSISRIIFALFAKMPVLAVPLSCFQFM